MTRTRLIVIAFLLAAILLSGCGASGEAVSDPAGGPLDMAAAIINSQADIPLLDILSPGQEAFGAYLTQVYGIPEEGLVDGAVCCAGGIEASELAVLAFSGEDAAKSAESALLDYIESRTDSFAGYVPEQAALVENSTAVRQGRYTALLICADPQAAREAFLSCFEEGWEPELTELTVLPPDGENAAPEPAEAEGEPAEALTGGAEALAEPPAREWAEDGTSGGPAGGTESPAESEPEAVSPPPDSQAADLPPDASEAGDPSGVPAAGAEDSRAEDSGAEAGDTYDRDAVVSAWRSGDPSGLSGKNRAVYDAAAAVISQVITDGMTPYQRELAIHDYITGSCEYDPEASSNAPGAAPDPDNGNPYGMLVNGVGICWGYSSTFQLFMDLLDIECVTVSGRSGQLEHAWNMVRLDGEWYCVDVTWDDPSGGSPGHRYFNVTSQFLRDNRHQWNQSAVPEASASRWAFQG